MKSEIILHHINIEMPITIRDDRIQLLIVENPQQFYTFVRELECQCEGGVGGFVASTQGVDMSIPKSATMLSDFFHFDLNDKKLLNLLYKKLEQLSYGDLIHDYNTSNAHLVTYLENLAYHIPFSLEYEEPQPADYFKSSGIRFAQNYDTLLEKIICYINILLELKPFEFLIFVNLKSILDDDSLSQLYSHCEREKVGLLLIEDCKRRELIASERALIITEDLCEILETHCD